MPTIPGRKLPNWISSWMDYTDPLPSPRLWRLWAGIALVAGALERKVWITTGIGKLYPNLYTILVGPPGLGKTVLTSQVWHFWNLLQDQTDDGFHLASSSITSASIIDELVAAKRKVLNYDAADPLTQFNSLAICSNELGVLLPEYENAFMSTLTDIYDGHPFSQSRRTKDIRLRVESPQLNLIAATTPSYLTGILPPGAWDQGFLSRTMIVFSSESLKRAVFSETKLQAALKDQLVADLRLIFTDFGPITMTDEAQQMLENWHAQGGPPIPEHPKLQHYLTRRTTHLLKLCMIACCVTGTTRVITKEHLQIALDWLLELELYIGDVFKAMVVGGDAQAMQECWFNFLQVWAKEQRPIAEGRIIAFLSERLPAHSVMRVVDVMERSGMLKAELMAGVGKAYTPRPRKH